MKKTKTSPSKLKSILGTQRLLIVIFIALFVVLASAQFIFNRAVWNRLDTNDRLAIKETLIDGVRSVSHEAPIDPKTGQVYFNDVHLRLPAYPSEQSPLRYIYDPGDMGNGPAVPQLWLLQTSQLQARTAQMRNAGNDHELFEQVPKAQACNRQITIAFQQTERDVSLKQVFTKKLSDGRMMYIYLDRNCQEGSTKLIEYLQRADSY